VSVALMRLMRCRLADPVTDLMIAVT
jgi:hypothetical protein